jgi:hypothetical protein
MRRVADNSIRIQPFETDTQVTGEIEKKSTLLKYQQRNTVYIITVF